jgi:hypothetical protein
MILQLPAYKTNEKDPTPITLLINNGMAMPII